MHQRASERTAHFVRSRCGISLAARYALFTEPWVLPRFKTPINRRALMKSRTRIALYSHDTVGLGHMRRNLLIARALSSSLIDPAVLMIAGNNRANAFAAPPGVDSVTLPALHKDTEGRYGAGTLPVPLQRLVTLRATTIRAALEAFDPDLLIVDKVPRGALGELMPTLASLKTRGRVKCVLGLRDVLDEPEVVQREWIDAQNDAVIQEYYSAVWIYGDRSVYDLAHEYRFSRDVAARMTYTGYLDQRARLDSSYARVIPAAGETIVPPGPQILCTVGGGQDGGPVARAFAEAQMPDGANGILLTGPFMPGKTLQQLRRTVGRRDHIVLLEFVPEGAGFMDRAERVITMGGYNTIAEVLSFAKPALVVPRVSPRREQLIRAERLQHLGVVDVLRPDRLSPDAISEWLATQRTSRARADIDLNGLSRIPILAQQVLETSGVGLASCVH